MDHELGTLGRMSGKRSVAFSFAIIFYSIFFIPALVQAQSSSIAVQRGLYDIELVAGSSQEEMMVVYNLDESQPLPVHLELSLWDLQADSDEIAYVSAEPAFNAAKWFSVKNSKGNFVPLVTTDFIINPDHRREIPFRITAPKDAIAGTYLVVARLRAVAPPQGGVTAVPEVNILFFIKVSYFTLEGGVESGYNAEIVDLFAKDEEASQRQGVPVAHAGVLDEAIQTVVAKIKNTGIFYFRADGVVELKNMLGRVVKKVELPKRYLLPNRVRTVEIPVEKQEQEQLGFFRSIARFWSENAYLGPYTATVFLNFPQATSKTEAGFVSASTLERSFTIWILPWKFWLPLVLIFALIIWVIKRGRGRFGAIWQALRGKS